MGNYIITKDGVEVPFYTILNVGNGFVIEKYNINNDQRETLPNSFCITKEEAEAELNQLIIDLEKLHD